MAYLGIGSCILLQHRSMKYLLKHFESEGLSTNVSPINTFMHLSENPLGLLGCQAIEGDWLNDR